MADRQTILDNEFITMWYYPDKKIIHHEFHKFSKGKPIRDALTAGVQHMEKTGCKKWLSDDRKNSVYVEEDRKWAESNYRPRILKAGIKFWAIILPEKAIGQLNMKHVIKKYLEKGVTVETFEDAKKAMKWLESE